MPALFNKWQRVCWCWSHSSAYFWTSERQQKGSQIVNWLAPVSSEGGVGRICPKKTYACIKNFGLKRNFALKSIECLARVTTVGTRTHKGEINCCYVSSAAGTGGTDSKISASNTGALHPRIFEIATLSCVGEVEKGVFFVSGLRSTRSMC